MLPRIALIGLALLGTTAPAWAARVGGRAVLGAAAGLTHYQGERDGRPRTQAMGSPVAGLEVVTDFEGGSLMVGLESQPTLFFTFGGVGHVWGIPLAMVTAGVEARPVPEVSLGVNGSLGLLAATAGVHARFHLARTRAVDHELLVRGAYLAFSSEELVVAYAVHLGRRS